MRGTAGLVVLLGCVEVATPPPTPPKTAEQVVAEMLVTYAHATTYSDHGTVDGLRALSFETAFVRGSRFRFAYKDQHGPYVIWSDGVHTYTYLPGMADIGRPELIDDGSELHTAIAAETGVSSGTAHTIPTMLLPSLGGWNRKLLRDLRIDGMEDIEGHACVRIVGGPFTMWIDRDLHLLRRLVTELRPGWKTTTNYEPSLDPVDAAQLLPPDLEKSPPQPRPPLPWVGVMLTVDNTRRVERVDVGSPAEHAGIAVGDVITAIDGTPISSFPESMSRLLRAKIGAQMRLTLSRNGNPIDVELTVASKPHAPPRPSAANPLVQ